MRIEPTYRGGGGVQSSDVMYYHAGCSLIQFLRTILACFQISSMGGDDDIQYGHVG